MNGGAMNGFLQPASNGLNAIGYYRERDLPFRSALVRNYTTCDAYFPSILGPTFPNRIFQHAGAIFPPFRLSNLHLRRSIISTKTTIRSRMCAMAMRFWPRHFAPFPRVRTGPIPC